MQTTAGMLMADNSLSEMFVGDMVYYLEVMKYILHAELVRRITK